MPMKPRQLAKPSLSEGAKNPDLAAQNPFAQGGFGQDPSPVPTRADERDAGPVFKFGRHEISGQPVVVGDATGYNVGLVSTAEVQCSSVDELDYDNGTQIGRGSSGKVFSVMHRPSRKQVCVKQMVIDDARHREEIKRELDSLHKTTNRFIVDFYGAFFHNELGVILLVLELMEGSLLEVLRLKKRLTEQQAKAFALQVMHGLKFLHTERRLIHRDIKPANLLFHRSGQVKITDFGVSTGQRSQDPQSVLTFVGSILYMSPERLEAKSYGYDCDIWSLGIMLCEAVTGYHPYQEEFGEQAEQLTFWGLLQKVMKADPERHRAPIRFFTRHAPKEVTAGVEVSAEMDDFVANCLRFDRRERWSPTQLLDHPWLQSMPMSTSEKIVSDIAIEVAIAKAAQPEPSLAELELERQESEPHYDDDEQSPGLGIHLPAASEAAVTQPSTNFSQPQPQTSNEQSFNPPTTVSSSTTQQHHLPTQTPQPVQELGPAQQSQPVRAAGYEQRQESRARSNALLNELLAGGAQ